MVALVRRQTRGATGELQRERRLNDVMVTGEYWWENKSTGAQTNDIHPVHKQDVKSNSSSRGWRKDCGGGGGGSWQAVDNPIGTLICMLAIKCRGG